MAFNCRVIGYSGISQIPQHFVRQYNSDSVFVMDEPPLWSQVLVVNGATPITTTSQNPDKATIVVVEVPDGQTIRYEVQPQGASAAGARTPGTASPSVSGRNQFFWYGAGCVFSCVDAASFP